jgi:NAD-dependent deacetylase
LRSAKRLVVFTGAGVSAESGIPTFRDDGGFWKRFPPEKFACWNGLLKMAVRDPHQVAEFIHCVIDPIAQAIAELEKRVDTTVITQNVDGLHQAAGSLRVREIHGSFYKLVTMRGKFVRRISQTDLQMVAARIDRARSARFGLLRLVWAIRPLIGPTRMGIRRPNLVLFGQGMAEPDWTWAQADARECDVMVVVGTSGQVWPAATLPIVAKQEGARVIDVDPDEAGHGHLWLRGKAGDVVPHLLAGMP